MRIVFVVTRSDAVGGAQVHVADMATALQAAGHEAIVLTGGDGPWLERLRERRVRFVALANLVRPISPLRDVLGFFELRRRLRELNPDVVSTHTAKAGWLGRLAAASLRLPVLFTAHGWTFTEGISRWQARVWRFAERLVGPLSDRILTVSEYDRQLALAAHICAPDRIRTIHNGMPDVAPSLHAEPGRCPPTIVTVARFESQKDHRTLMRALAMLKDLPWTLSCVGDGPLLESMQALARELGIGDRVSFLGARSDVAEILSGAQVFALCTLWEGLPRSIIEAMRAGLPVVATAVAGVPEMVEHGANGLLCRPRDIGDVASQLRSLIESADRRVQMGSRARQRFLDGFQFDRMYARTVQTYEALLGSAVEAPRSAVRPALTQGLPR